MMEKSLIENTVYHKYSFLREQSGAMPILLHRLNNEQLDMITIDSIKESYGITQRPRGVIYSSFRSNLIRWLRHIAAKRNRISEFSSIHEKILIYSKLRNS